MSRDWTADQRGVSPEKKKETGNAGRGVGGQADDGSSDHNRGLGKQRDDGRWPADDGNMTNDPAAPPRESR